MTAREFVLRFAWLCAFFLACIAAFNRIVDPFWYYRDLELEGFNAVKALFGRYEREVKPALLAREQAEAVIFGSSFSEIGFDPTHPGFTDQGRLKGMNFAMAGSSWKMELCAFQFALTHARIKRALVQIIPGEKMPVADCAKDFPYEGDLEVGKLLFSSLALNGSLKTVSRQNKDKLTHTREGMYFGRRGRPGVDKRFKKDFAMTLAADSKCLQSSNRGDEKTGPLKPASLDLSGLQQVLEMAKKHQVALTLYAIPRHVYSLELMRQCGHEEAMWRALKQIAYLNEQQNDSPVPIWQFYAFNGFTTETIGDTASYWQDSTHFNFEMGALMLSDMFNLPPDKPALGKPVFLEGIDAAYQGYLRERAAYLQKHPGFMAGLQKLLPLSGR